MDNAALYAVLKSLLERLEADARLEQPRMGGLISQSEVGAIELVVRQLGSRLASGSATDMSAGSKSAEAAVTPHHDSAADASKRLEPLRIDDRALSRRSAQDQGIVLCIDFGTAKSKAFAASKEDDPKLFEIALGKCDLDADNAVYPVSSSVWIEDDGLMFAGSEAIRRGGIRASEGIPARRRLDSLKQELSQVLPSHQIASQRLAREVNPSSVALTFDDAITFYLAYLTDLATTELQERHHISRYVRRRFTLPWWQIEHQTRAAQLLSARLACAQVLADTFHGRWKDGIPASHVKSAIEQTLPRVQDLMYLIETKEETHPHSLHRYGAILEPLAAGSSRIWMDGTTRDLVMVLDVGAGTTDLSLFWVVQNVEKAGHQAFPVHPCGTAIRMAGDHLDSALVSLILDKAQLGADPSIRQRVSSALFLGGIRRLKEQLFSVGELSHRLVNDQIVSLALDEFLSAESVRNFTMQLQHAIEAFLNSVDASWAPPMAKVKLVLTGGGCDLPMIKELANQEWHVSGHKVHFQRTANIPEVVTQRFDENFSREYPQLAVALGGALPLILDEGNAQDKWYGGAHKPGTLERYPVTGG